MMDPNPSVIFLDDGELDDVRAVIKEMGGDFEQWDKSDVLASLPNPTNLLVTTATHAISARLRRSPVRSRDRAVWIAVATGNSKSQRSAILGAGFDYLVRRPVHSGTLRSLVRGILYQGNEQRLKRRVAVGYTISFRVNKRGPAVDALLMDLSPGGCRMLTRHSVQPKSELELRFPAELTGTKAFSYRGTATRTSPGSIEGGEADESCIGVRFLSFHEASRKPILALLNTLTSGPAVLPEALAAAKNAPVIRSRFPRGVYDKEVPIFGSDNYVLIGRDLSQGGLRVDPHPALKIGATLGLVLGGATDAEPVRVDARVIRDDGKNGVALHFDWIEPGSEKRLRFLIEQLPAIEAPTANAKQRTGIVLTSVIPKILRRRHR